MATKKSAKKHQLVHPLARRVADNAWLLLKGQSKYRNPHQLGVAAERAGHAAKNTIRNIFYPEARPLGKNDSPTAPTLDSLEAAAKALGVEVHDFLDPDLATTQRMRAQRHLLHELFNKLYADCPDLFTYTDPFTATPAAAQRPITDASAQAIAEPQ